MSEILVGAPLRLEQLAIKLGAARLRTSHTGMGPKRSKAAVASLKADPAAGLVVMGVCGGLDGSCQPGEVIVAEELLDGEHPCERRLACPSAEPLASALESRGLKVKRATVVSMSRIVHGEERARLRERGALVVDMESVWLAEAAADRPFAVIRVVADTASREVTRPLMTLVGAWRAALSLRRTAATLDALVRERGVGTVLGDGTARGD
jgi:4-hydroxy-3-methylbut-2-enyl diphosphate reductase